jgi:hypothetical protein
VMKPKPLASLNHLTVPELIVVPYCSVGRIVLPACGYFWVRGN